MDYSSLKSLYLAQIRENPKQRLCINNFTTLQIILRTYRSKAAQEASYPLLSLILCEPTCSQNEK